MAVTDSWVSGLSFTAADEDLVARAINGSGWLQPCQWATTGSETFTITSGSVTQIAGGALDGGSPSVNDRVLVKDAPATTGTGSALSDHPANGIYQITGISSNMTLARVYEMSASPGTPYFPGGEVVAVQQGTASAGLTFIVTTPSNPDASFTYGTNNIQWAPLGYGVGTGLALSGSTIELSSGTLTSLGLANTSLQAAGNVLTVSGTTVQVSSMSTGTIVYGDAGTPTIGSLGGDATIGATGSLTIAAAAVSLSKMANLTAHTVIGNSTGSAATPTALALTSSGAASSVTMTDANGNLTANAFLAGVATTANGGTTTTLTVSSKPFQQFTGTSTQTVVMPDATTMANGQAFYVTNRSSNTVTVENHGASTLQAMAAGSQALFELVSNGTTNGTWDVSYTVAGLTGTVTTVSVASANGFGGTVATATSTPAITITTSVTGLLKGNGTAVSAATSGTDYAPATTGTSILKASSGGFANATSGTDYAPATSGSSALKGNGSGGFSNAVLNDVGTATGNYSLGGFLINSLGTPSVSTDAATKGYVDTLVQGLSAKYSAVAATNTETLTITSGSVTQITGTTVNGVSPNVNDYVLVMNAPVSTGAAGGTTLSTEPANGLYQVTGNTTNLSVSRATDMSGSVSPVGTYIFVAGGTTWGSGGYVVTTPSTSGSFTYGTNNITFTQFTGAGEITAGTGISKSGNTLSVNLTGSTAITVTGASIAVTNSSIGVTQLSATGTASSSTYLRGDNTWQNFASAVGSAFTGGTGITISGSTISITNSSVGITQLSATGTASSSTYLRGDNAWTNFNTAVEAISLTSMTAPSGNVSWNSFQITSLANPSTATAAANKIYVDSTGFHLSCNWATVGTETFTISSGTVTQISGTSLDSGSPSVNDRVLIKDAPSSSGTGSVLSNVAGNGIYIVTSNTTNLSVSRVSDLSSGGVYSSPAGSAVVVSGGSANAFTSWVVGSPTNQNTAFTYGTTAMQWSPLINSGNVLTRSGNTMQVASMSTGNMIYGNGGTPTIGSITGDWTVSSSGVVTIGTAVVTLAKMANLAANSVIANTSGSSATPAAVALSSSGAASSVTMTDANGNLWCNNLFEGWATTVTSGTLVTLTISSAQIQQFTGSTAQTVKLPTTSVVAGQTWVIISASSAAVTIEASGGGTIAVLAGVSSGTIWAEFTANSSAPTSAGGWDYCYMGSEVASGKLLTVNNTLTFAGTDGTTLTFPSAGGNVLTSSTGVAEVTGTPSSTTYLRGDGSWATPSGSGGSTTPTANTGAEWDSNLNLSANNVFEGYSDTITSGGTTTLAVTDDPVQVFTGASVQTVKLPSTSVPAGAQYMIINQAAAAVTVESSSGATILVMASNTSAVFTSIIATPTLSSQWLTQYGGVAVNSGVVASVTTSGTVLTTGMGVPNANLPNGIVNANSALQSQVTVAATPYYITSSNLALPSTPLNGIQIGSTFRWRVAFGKNAAGTGAFSLIVYRGTNGTTSDTADVTQAITGTATAGVDHMVVDVQVVVTATGSSGSYYWTMVPFHQSASTLDFNVVSGTIFTGSATSKSLALSPLTFGLGFQVASGGTMPTITIPLVEAQTLNVC